MDPRGCPHGTYVGSVDRTLCRRDGKRLYTNCHLSIAGEPPACAFDEPDNSDEATFRRRGWMRLHGRSTE